MLLDHPLVGRRVFYPRPTDVEPDLVVDVGDARLGCYVRRRHPRAGFVVYFHGNGELAAEYAVERLYAWGADKRLVVFPTGDHNTILFANFRDYIRAVREFLGRVGVALDPQARD